MVRKGDRLLCKLTGEWGTIVKVVDFPSSRIRGEYTVEFPMEGGIGMKTSYVAASRVEENPEEWEVELRNRRSRREAR